MSEPQCIFCGTGLGTVITRDIPSDFCDTCRQLSTQVKVSEQKIYETMKIEGSKITQSMSVLINRIQNYHQYLKARADNLERENSVLKGGK